MERMIIKHISGSKANQVEEFALKHHNELIFGRETTSTVQYDPDRDDLVGRQHAKIQKDPDDANGFIISDLSSRNGTFVNNSKITAPTKITAGDIVQFGPDGPKFQFELEPRPVNVTRPTRIAEVGKNTPQTRVATPTAPAQMNIPVGSESVATQVAPKAGVGKATVERMISRSVEETKKQERSKFAAVGGAAAFVGILLIGSLAFGSYYYNTRKQQTMQEQIEAKSSEVDAKTKELENKSNEAQSKAEEAQKRAGENGNATMTAATVAEKNGKAVVFILGSWKLVNEQSKSQIYHQFIPNNREYLTKLYGVNYGRGPIISNGSNVIPVYVQTGETYEPILTDTKSDFSYPIGGTYTGSGFIVTDDGYILTNRHISSPSKAMHFFPQNYPGGVLIDQNGQIVDVNVDPPTHWIPENTKSVGKQFRGKFATEGRLRVMLPGSDNQIEAQFIQASPRHDVGMIKISVPGSLSKVELHDNFDTLKKGEDLVVMGYPGSAPVVFKLNLSKDFLNQEAKETIIPDPTVSTTSIGNIVKSELKNLENLRVSDSGDSIRYAVSLTGGGNSGGPVFDMQGRVVGIHFAGDGKQAGFAVPIRYGMQLFPNYTPNSGS
jgi:serine protease Do